MKPIYQQAHGRTIGQKAKKCTASNVGNPIFGISLKLWQMKKCSQAVGKLTRSGESRATFSKNNHLFKKITVMAINTFFCSACGDKFKPPKKVLKQWNAGETETPTLCPDCLQDTLCFQNCTEEIYCFSDADIGL